MTLSFFLDSLPVIGAYRRAKRYGDALHEIAFAAEHHMQSRFPPMGKEKVAELGRKARTALGIRSAFGE